MRKTVKTKLFCRRNFAAARGCFVDREINQRTIEAMVSILPAPIAGRLRLRLLGQDVAIFVPKTNAIIIFPLEKKWYLVATPRWAKILRRARMLAEIDRFVAGLVVLP